MASIHSDTGSTNLEVAPLPPSTTMTEEEFVAWCDEDTRAEWVDGEVIIMSPVSTDHGRLTWFILSLLNLYAQERDLGEALGPEVTVRINSKRRRLPDVFFVAKERSHLLLKNHFEGAPSLIVEVVSEDSVDRDWRVKYLEYERAGVDEYWVIDPLYQRMEAYALEAGKGYRSIAPMESKIASRVVTGFYLRREWLWQRPLPKVPALLSELLAQFKGE